MILGGGGANWPPGILADPPTHPHQKIFPQEKNEIYQRGPNLEVDFRYTNFFLASEPPPPPRCSINQPLSKGLVQRLGRRWGKFWTGGQHEGECWMSAASPWTASGQGLCIGSISSTAALGNAWREFASWRGIAVRLAT